MKAEQIVKQLITVLPRYTNLFNDEIDVISLTKVGNTVKAITSQAHGLSNGEIVFITGALTPIVITNLYHDPRGTAYAETESDHDLTDRYTETVNIIGANDEEYNGEHKFIHQPNRRQFSFSITGNPNNPIIGSPKLIQNKKYGYNGLHIVTVVDDVTFTYEEQGTYGSPAIGNIKVNKNFRISDAISVDKVAESYTKQETDKCWAFVVLGDHAASRDRYTESDLMYASLKNEDFKQDVQQPFYIYVVIPTVTSISGAQQRDLMEDISVYLFKSILKLELESGFDAKQQFGITFVGHGFYDYVRAYYIHRFEFNYYYRITYQDCVDTDDSVAFRDVVLQFRNTNDVNIVNTNDDLDDVPLT